MAVGIELASFLIAQAVGLYIVFVGMADGTGVVFAYVLAVVCGALGSRLSAMWRERQSVLKVVASGLSRG